MSRRRRLRRDGPGGDDGGGDKTALNAAVMRPPPFASSGAAPPPATPPSSSSSSESASVADAFGQARNGGGGHSATPAAAAAPGSRLQRGQSCSGCWSGSPSSGARKHSTVPGMRKAAAAAAGDAVGDCVDGLPLPGGTGAVTAGGDPGVSGLSKVALLIVGTLLTGGEEVPTAALGGGSVCGIGRGLETEAVVAGVADRGGRLPSPRVSISVAAPPPPTEKASTGPAAAAPGIRGERLPFDLPPLPTAWDLGSAGPSHACAQPSRVAAAAADAASRACRPVQACTHSGSVASALSTAASTSASALLPCAAAAPSITARCCEQGVWSGGSRQG